LGQGKEKAAEFVGAQPALEAEIRARVLEAIGSGKTGRAPSSTDGDEVEA
jgi:hypothetical protein